jgi:tRNA A-37 threonylcarbamoyl transferase component Bud32
VSDETRVSDTDETRLADGRGSRPPSSASGWLTSSDSIDHGRFPPGTLLGGGRYRIVGRLGRGGMGEVFRADDLKLGQVVALKFLPPDVDRDPARLTQLHTEVRMARQVSHPNICRVYDIDEEGGSTFLSMEYIDGEDLASLLKRVGRFPQDRALEISRQLCAGLAAAHDRGVVHRDLKPANVMIDAGGDVRITDFGLAGLAGESLRAGTPAYMAPEQLAGGEVTARSDIYALGLVVYEVFTGQRALDAKNLAELIRMREQSGIVPPSALVRDLDPQIETTILRCLRPSPAQRPNSALAVAASLPGGDPLAAALAAGETPSPEMVAAAGTADAVQSHWVTAGLAWIAVALVALTLTYQRVMLINRVPSGKPPAALQDRAQEALAKLGYDTSSHYAAAGLSMSTDYARFIARTTNARDRWKLLATDRPETLVSWYRTSPRPLVALENGAVQATNPPLTVGGMTLTVVDASGRLAEFIAVPPPFDDGSARLPTNWNALFESAGIPFAAFKPVTPTFNPIVFSDERMAWEGRLNEHADQVFRIEAAAYKGKPVSFEIVGPWSQSARAIPSPPSPFDRFVNAMTGIVMPGLLVAGLVLAHRNLKLGRGDRRGATRAASIVFAAMLLGWLLGTTHYANIDREISRIFARCGDALFQAAVLWVTYLGLEPYIRRFSPDSLIGWTRLISGQWKDPHVGRDVLLGISAGLVMTVFYGLHNLLPPLFDRPEPIPISFDPTVTMGLRYALASIVSTIGSAVTNAMLAVVGVVALLIVLKRPWAAGIAAVCVFVWPVIQGMFPPGTPLLDLVVGTSIIAVFVAVILRYGLLATIAALATHFMLLRAPLTTQFDSWRAPAGVSYIVVLGGIGVLAAWLSRQRATA